MTETLISSSQPVIAPVSSATGLENLGFAQRLALTVTGQSRGDVGAMLLVAIFAFVTLVPLSFVIASPRALGGPWFSLASGVAGAVAGSILGGLFTPTSKGEARRFSNVGSFLAGVGGAVILSAVKDDLVRNLKAAFTNPEFAGPMTLFLCWMLAAAAVTVTARKSAADQARLQRQPKGRASG